MASRLYDGGAGESRRRPFRTTVCARDSRRRVRRRTVLWRACCSRLPKASSSGGGRNIRQRLRCAAAIFNSFNSQEEDGTIRCLFLISGRAGARQRQLRLRCSRHGVPRPLRRPCRHFDRPCASALRADDLGAGRTAGILLQFGGKLVAAHAGRAAGSIVGLRRLPAFPLQLGRRSQ